MIQRSPSVLDRVLTAAAERLAQSPAIPVQARAEFQRQAFLVMQDQWSRSFGGESLWVRIYAPKVGAQAREERRGRILQALDAGMSTLDAARAHGVTERYVRKLRNSPRVESSGPPAEHEGNAHR